MKEKIMELLAAKKYSELAAYLDTLNCADLADVLEDIQDEYLIIIYRLLSKELAVDMFSYMETETQEKLIRAFTDRELKEVMDELFIDDTVDIIAEMPANVVSRMLKNTDAETRHHINTILNYPKDSAGSIMTIEYVNLKKHMTVGESLKRIRQVGVDKETIYTCYVTENRKLLGIVTVKDLLTSGDERTIDEIMETNVISVSTLEDQETVAKMFNKYDFLALPVVDKEQCLVGIVTVDDAMDVMEDEATEDITKMAAMSPSEESYFQTSVFKHAKNRIVWLLVLMLSATVTGSIITHYEEAFAAIPLLVSFIPMLMDTSGNCGSQSSTLMIRGLALDEICFRDIFKVMFKELRIAVIVSSALSVVNGIRVFIMYKDLSLALVVSCTLLLTIVIAKLIGCTLPLVAKKCRLDPAIMAAPLITTLVDACAILIYFRIATIIFQL